LNSSFESDTYKTIRDVSEGLYKEKGSKFLSFAHPVSSVEDVKLLLGEYRKTYYDARHVCYAYILGPQGLDYRANDDGEPTGTAGRPILGQLLSFGLTDVLVVVVRYFGGVLLGTGGLVVAYKSAASEALQAADVLEKTVQEEFKIHFEFPFMKDVMRIVKNRNAQILEQGYDLDCILRLQIRKINASPLKEALGKVESLWFED